MRTFLLALLASAVLLAAGGLLALRRLAAEGRLKGALEAYASRSLGRTLEIGDVSIERWLPPAVSASRLRLTEKDGKPLASAERAVVTLRLGGLATQSLHFEFEKGRLEALGRSIKLDGEADVPRQGRRISARLRVHRIDGRILPSEPRLSLSLSGPSFSLLLEGATTQLRMTGRLPERKGGTLELRLKSDRADVGELLAWARALSTGPAEGAGKGFRASGVGTIEGRLEGASGPEFAKVATGSVTVRVTDGVLWDPPVVLKVLSAANLTSLVRWVETSGKGKGLPFDRLDASLSIRNGRIVAEQPIVLESDTLRLGFAGSLDLSRGNLEGKAAVSAVSVVDEVIRRLPLVRNLLHGDDKTWAPVWLAVTGPVSDPKVRLLAGRTITAPVWNVFGRILKLPSAALGKSSKT